jgi:pyruvate,water dikinase
MKPIALFKQRMRRVFTPSQWMLEKYRNFKELLHFDRQSQELMAELETILFDQVKVDFSAIEMRYAKLSRAVAEVIDGLGRMSVGAADSLKKRWKLIDFQIRQVFPPARWAVSPPFVLDLDAISPGSEELVGGKAARLAQIRQTLRIPVPEGFVITANAFNAFIEGNGLRPILEGGLASLDPAAPEAMAAAAGELAALVSSGVLPAAVGEAIRQAYRRLSLDYPAGCRVCVRSSAVGEDTGTSFAGQYRTVLNVTEANLADAYKEVIASKYSPRALSYRISHGLLDRETPMAVLVVKMIAAKSSGVLYTRNPVQPESDSQTVYAAWGLGELLVSGGVAPDLLEVARTAKPAVVRREMASRGHKVVAEGAGFVRTATLDEREKAEMALDDQSAERLAGWGLQLEGLFGEPQDVEWCQDQAGNLAILQSRPLHLESPTQETTACSLVDASQPVLISGGEKAASGVAAGKVCKALRSSDLGRVPPDSVLVAPTTSPEFASIIGRLSAVVTDIGSCAGHFASIAREFGVPTLVNTRIATQVLKDGEMVTVFADAGKVFAGRVDEWLNGPCARRNPLERSPFRDRLAAVLELVSPLNLVDPRSLAFSPENCQTIHDILRFAHEKAVQQMFFFGGSGGRKLKGAKRFRSRIPILLYVLDLGQGLRAGARGSSEVHQEDVSSVPFRAVWQGLSHPDIHWSPEIVHFDWQALDRMSAGIVSLESPLLASYAILSEDYLNLSVHFGYHFVVVDTLCGPVSDENYIFFHFKGGGAAPENRRLRVQFLALVLEEHGFETKLMGDLIDAQLRRVPAAALEETLEMLGRLLGCTRLLDMVLQDEAMAVSLAAEFLKGNYGFAAVDENEVRVQRRYFERRL